MDRQKLGTKWLLPVIVGSFVFGMFGLSTFANVSLQNGNFFIGYKDLVYPGGYEPKIERVYNSKSSFSGMFGFGWGSEYEVHLSVGADGSVTVHEFGGGADNRFVPKGFRNSDVKKAVGQIAKAAQKSGAVSTKSALKKYRAQLTNDATFRSEEFAKFVAQGKLKPKKVKTGTQFISNRFSYQYITKTKKGFKRVFDNGKVETFNNRGRLVKVQDKNGNWISFKYGKDGHLAKIEDNLRRKMFLKFNSKGLLQSVRGENKKVATYKYNDKNELVESKDAAGNVYKYTYDRFHNMTEIKYGDGTSMKIAYYGKDKNQNVKTKIDRDGTRSEYKYDLSKTNKDRYAVSVTVYDKGNKKISSSKYEYVYKRKKGGERYTYRMATTIDGLRTETTYNECCGLPILIKRGKEVTKFKYDKKGHVTFKDTPTERVNLSYSKSCGKVTVVKRTSKITKRKRSSNFKYDKKCNLKFAKNSDGKGVRLFYDRNGRIKTMRDQNKREISFTYNENSKPIKITDPKLGSIKVSYTDAGKIKKVSSTAGRKIALQVTSAFQNLLDIIRPAGVSLAF